MDRPLKIGLVSPYDHAFLGGVSDHINHLASQFRSWGHHVRVVAPCSRPEEISDENFIPVGRSVPIPSGGSIARVSLSAWQRPKIRAMLEREQFDILHMHEPFAGIVTLESLALSQTVNIGTFHTYRGHKIYKFGGVRIGRRFFRKLQGRIAVSEPAHEFISSYFPGDYQIIPNGIFVDEFADASPFDHLRDGMINLLFVGRLEKRKGLKYLLRAFAKLKWDWANLRLLVVGPGKPDDDSYRIMSECNIQDVHFLGQVSDADKARYYKSADIYCSPATGRESFGIVLLEAMAAGKPIVASDIEGYASVVSHGGEALLVPPKDDDGLAKALGLLLSDPGLRQRLGASGLKKVQRYRWERVAGQVMDYYTSLLTARAPVAP